MNLPPTPVLKRAVAFFDGQNLFRHAHDAFGHYYPNYDPRKLFNAICSHEKWKNCGIKFYTGVPIIEKDPKGHATWTSRLRAMSQAGIKVVKRDLRYRGSEIVLSDGSPKQVDVPQEKGIDIRIALDVIRATLGNEFDVAVIFSQDQDLAELPVDVTAIATSQNRVVEMISAFPAGPKASCPRGIYGMKPFEMDETFYNACLDETDHRPPPAARSKSSPKIPFKVEVVKNRGKKSAGDR